MAFKSCGGFECQVFFISKFGKEIFSCANLVMLNSYISSIALRHAASGFHHGIQTSHEVKMSGFQTPRLWMNFKRIFLGEKFTLNFTEACVFFFLKIARC